ncbi:MAG: hypothetical protein IJR41_04640 [Atopobiaceae bacterium]|nr:hypothetical protein [Atopobiaceae bacterium]
MKYFLPNRLYDVLKWTGLIACPAIAVFYGVVAPAWDLPYPDQVVLTLNAAGVLIGALIGASAVTAKEGADGD